MHHIRDRRVYKQKIKPLFEAPTLKYMPAHSTNYIWMDNSRVHVSIRKPYGTECKSSDGIRDW